MEVMTVEDALMVTIKLLESIRIPATMSEEVGIPIMKSIANINVCVNALAEAKKKTNEEVKEKENGREADSE